MYEKIYDIDNLYRASHNALKGKKSKRSAARFWLYEDREICKMHQELKSKTYTFGGYSSFILHDNGVDRRISVAPFRDRVLHHAIMQQIEPVFEKSFIYDSYANRKGKGTSSALKRARYFANKYRYVLQLDIQKFFPSIDHKILSSLLVKEKLRVKGYIRYVDDTLYFSNSKDFLRDIMDNIKDFLATFRLKLHPLKVKLLESSKGFVFLGHKVYKTHFRLTSKAIRRGRKNLKKVCYDYRYGRSDLTGAKNSIFGTIGFFKMGNNAKIIDKLLAQTVLKKEPFAEVVPSGRFVEQQCQ